MQYYSNTSNDKIFDTFRGFFLADKEFLPAE
jgi:hypothetical protein